MMDEIKHSVLMITYNQENQISDALNSIFANKILPYEIIIGDDASNDNTWEIIEKFKKKYPSIIKTYKNEHNIGIFRNYNKISKLPSGNIVSFLAGDDLYKPNIFEKFNESLQNESVDINNDKFILISNSIKLLPNHKEIIYNNYQYRNKDLFKIKLRYGLDFRDTGFSIALLKCLPEILTDLGYYADWIHCIEQILNAQKFIFINEALTYYRSFGGTISKTNGKILADSKLKVINYIIAHYKFKMDDKDILYLKKEKKMYEYSLQKNPKDLLLLSIYIYKNRHNYLNLKGFLNDLKFLFLSYGGLILRMFNLRR
jgi:glycosyltransferase involved in cell wall biosynthesis